MIQAGPPLGLALLPIVLPLGLLLVGSLANPGENSRGLTMFDAMQDYTLVLGLAAAVAIIIHSHYGDPNDTRSTDRSTGNIISNAIADAGVIVLLTAAGGAFGGALRQAGVGTLLSSAMSGPTPTAGVGTSVLPLAFAVTVFMRAAQGSATVAMLTVAAIVAPMVQAGLTFDPLYLALAIGCGSKPLAWMNDSGFWLVGRLSGMTVRQTLQTFSAALTIMGGVGFIAVWTAAVVLPKFVSG